MIIMAMQDYLKDTLHVQYTVLATNEPPISKRMIIAATIYANYANLSQ